MITHTHDERNKNKEDVAQSKGERNVRPELCILSKLSPPPWLLWIQNHSGAERETDGLDMVEAPE